MRVSAGMKKTGLAFTLLETIRQKRRVSLTGFTLVELVTVLVIVGISLGLFYSLFYLNWTSLQRQLALNDLVAEAARIIERISFDTKMAVQIDLPDNKTAQLTYQDGSSNTYSLVDSGQIQRNGQIISEYINFDESSFEMEDQSLIVSLLLEDDILSQVVQLPVETEAFCRNR